MADAPLVFAVNGVTVRLANVDPSVKLVEFLRHWVPPTQKSSDPSHPTATTTSEPLTGTKIGCNEGGCGACTVLVSYFDAAHQRIVSVSANACLRPLATLHGQHVTTVEGLGSPAHPHKLQARFSKLSASQCGFCTPGFVMSIYAQFARKPDSGAADMEACMDGNLCRCTGYRPILDVAKSFAAKHSGAAPSASPPAEEAKYQLLVDDQDGRTSEGLDAQREIEALFPAELRKYAVGATPAAILRVHSAHGVVYHAPESIAQVFQAAAAHPGARVVCSQTSAGVYKDDLPHAASVIDVSRVPELHVARFEAATSSATQGALTIGAAVSIEALCGELLRVASEHPSVKQPYVALVEQFTKIAGHQVRGVASLGGNIIMNRERGFASDLCTALCAVGASVQVFTGASTSVVLPLRDFLANTGAAASLPAQGSSTGLYLLANVTIPAPPAHSVLRCYRTAIRTRNAHAIVNAAFLAEAVTTDGGVAAVQNLHAWYGIVGDIDVPHGNAPKLLPLATFFPSGRRVAIDRDFRAALQGPRGDAVFLPSFVQGAYKAGFRRLLVRNFLDKFLDDLPTATSVEQSVAAPVHVTSQSFQDGTATLTGPPGTATPSLGPSVLTPTGETKLPIDGPQASQVVGAPTPRPDGILHATGRAVYPSDVAERPGTVFAAWVLSTQHSGTLTSVPVATVAATQHGFVAYLDAAAVHRAKADNQLPSPLAGLPFPVAFHPTRIFADAADGNSDGPTVIEYQHQPIGLVVATTQAIAIRIASQLSKAATYAAPKGGVDPVPVNLTEARRRVADGSAKALAGFVHARPPAPEAAAAPSGDAAASPPPPRPAASDPASLQSIRASIALPTQTHWYMETHTAYVYYEDDMLIVHCASQWPEMIHRSLATVLRVPMSTIRVRQVRIGGAFGGKVQARHAAAAAIASRLLNRPVKIHVDRTTDTQLQGGRPEKQIDLDVSYDRKSLEIESLSLAVHLGNGAALDFGAFLPFGCFPRSALHSYRVKSDYSGSYQVYQTAYPGRCPVRAPGELECAYIGEEIIDRIAFDADTTSHRVRLANLMDWTDRNAQGAAHHMEEFSLAAMWTRALSSKGWQQRIDAVAAFNDNPKNVHWKKGAALTPFAYHLTTSEGNVSVTGYVDGSFVVVHGGTEMGQGLTVKVQQAVLLELNRLAPITLDKIRCIGSDSICMPHGICTGGSVGSESNVAAAIRATRTLVDRLRPVIEKVPEAARHHWPAICMTARFMGRLDMVGTGVHTGVPPDSVTYTSYTIGATEVTVDVRSGEIVVDAFDLFFDCARSLNPAVDIGQAEGALMMGLGHMLLENAGVDPATGAVTHPNTWEYKIPIARDVPRSFNVFFHSHDGVGFAKGVMSSKASGEPPLCVAPAVVSAIRQAIVAARKSMSKKRQFPELSIPLTPDIVAMAIAQD